MFIYPKEYINFNLNSSFSEENRENQKEKYTNGITEFDFFSLNEIAISQRILQIKNYSRYFNPILKNSTINLAEIDDECFERFEDIPDSKDKLLIKRLNIENYPSFYEIFYETKRETRRCNKKCDPKNYLLTLINSYKHLLEAIKKLEINQLVNLDFHPSTLVYKENLPIFTEFSRFFHLKTMNEERKSFLFDKYNPKNVFLPTEAHLICFLIENKQESVSNANIEEIVKETGVRLGSLSCFTKAFIEQYKEATHFSLQSFINKPKKVIIQEILLKSSSWNGFGLSILFIVLLRDIFRPFNGFPKNHFISQFSQILTMGIHPIPEKRPTPMQNISLFNDILYNTDKQDFLSLFATLSRLL